jgi:hypothetical protein
LRAEREQGADHEQQRGDDDAVGAKRRDRHRDHEEHEGVDEQPERVPDLVGALPSRG